MSEEKFIHDCHTVLKFIQLYCDEKHTDCDKKEGNTSLVYNQKDTKNYVNYKLCEKCEDTFIYTYKKLQECPHDEKPSCRKCPSPCYERSRWKHLASIMRFSGMRLGLLKIKKLFLK